VSPLVQRAYELAVIWHGDLEEAVYESSVSKLRDQLAAAGNQVEVLPDLRGKRRFAYEIDHKTEGYYAVFQIATTSAGFPDVERQLRLADEVVRHKLIRLPDREAARRGLFGQAAPA
jgi:small subunit ribosomal protein S6